MKVAFATQYPYEVNRFPGGVHTAGYNLARGLLSVDDLDIKVVTVSGEAPQDLDRTDDGLPVHFIAEPRFRLVPNMTTNIRRVSSYIRNMKPDLVNANMVVYAVAGIRAGVPTVFTVHGIVHREAQVCNRPLDQLRYKLYMKYDREVMAKVQHVIATSPYVIDEYKQVTGAEFHVIDNCIDDRFFQVPNNEEPKRLLFGGLIYGRKNVLGLLEIAKRLIQRHPELKLRIAGKAADPTYYKQCVSFAADNGMERNVDFLGLITVETMMEELSRASMLLLPSKQETAPLVISEALAAGKPVVASNAGGTAGLVHDGETGFIAEWWDNDRFVECIDKLLCDDALRERMGVRAREEAVRRFSKEAVAVQTARVYEEILRG